MLPHASTTAGVRQPAACGGVDWVMAAFPQLVDRHITDRYKFIIAQRFVVDHDAADD
jgi:hypothetical protein